MIEDIQNSQIRWEISRRKLLIAREALKAAQKTVKNLESQTNDLYQSYKLTLSSSLNAVVSYSAPTPLQIKAMNIVNSFKIIDEPTMKTPPKKLKQIEAPSIRSPGLSPKISDSPNFDTQIKVLKLQPYKAPFAKKIILKPEPYLKDISYHRILGYLTRHEKRIKNFEFNLNQQSRSWLNNPLTTLIFLFKIDSTLDISTLKCIVNNSQLQVPKKSDLLLDYYSFTLSTALSNLLDGVNKLIISRAIQIGFVAIVENESANDLCKMVINHKDYQLPESESLNLIKVIDLVHLFDLTHDGSRVLVPVRGSTCSHANVFCLVKWLIRGSNTCPICFKVVDLHSQSDSLIMHDRLIHRLIEESGGILNEIAITKEGHWDKNFKKPAPTPILIKCTFCDNVGHTEAVCKSKRKVQELTNDSFNLSNKYKRRVESIVISDDDEKQSNTNNLPGKFKNQVVGRSTKVSKVASGRKKVSAPGEICIKWNKKKCNGGCQRIHVCLICFSADHGKDDCNKTVIS